MWTLILSETSSDRITNYQSMNGIEGKCNNFFLFLNGWADYFDLYRKLNVKIWRMIWHIPIFGEFFRLTTMRESGPCLIDILWKISHPTTKYFTQSNLFFALLFLFPLKLLSEKAAKKLEYLLSWKWFWHER